MEVGVLFDIDELGGGFYGQAAWAILMRAVSPTELTNCTFFSGDTADGFPSSKRPYSFCIGIDALAQGKVASFKGALLERDDKGLLPRENRFAEGNVRAANHLVTDGYVDPTGTFVMADTDCLWLISVAQENGWRCRPSDSWLGKFAAGFALRRLTLSRDFDPVAKQALLEAGRERTLAAARAYLDGVQDEETRRLGREQWSTLEEIWPTEAAKQPEPAARQAEPAAPRPGLLSRVAGFFSGKPNNQAPSGDLSRAQALIAEKQWQAALWWLIKTLEADPSSRPARELFLTALANCVVGQVTLLKRNENARPSAINLLQRRRMSRAEAEQVADFMISVFYLELVQEKSRALLDRYNQRKLHGAARLSKDDLDSAGFLASGLADEQLPEQKIRVRWVSQMPAEADAFLASGISAQREALIILLRASSPSEWRATCQQLHRLWAQDPKQQELAASFARMADDDLSQAEFGRHQAEFEQVFARNATQLLHTRNCLRRPE